MLKRKILYGVLVIGMVQFVFLQEACAYIDPGMGSYVLQIVIASAVGAIYAIKRYWHYILGFFRHRLFKK